MLKNLTFYFNHSKKDLSYSDSYTYFATLAEKNGIDIRFVFGDKLKQGIVPAYWKYKDGTFKRYDQPYNPDLVYLRNRVTIPDSIKRINGAFLEEISRDKLLTYKTFPDLVKKTEILNSRTQISKFTTDKVVIKPRYGANGTNVHVLDKNNITSEYYDSDTFVIQELIDSSCGIEGLITTKHELRVFLFDGEITAAYVRIPADHSYLANISQGGKEMQISLSQLPANTKEVVDAIDKRFNAISPRIYTIDIMYEHNHPWVVELNDNPGMPDIAVQPFTDNYFLALIKFIKKCFD